ncbi:MAG: hypothetical protein R3C16_10640 [Hyphomonadaceae bacterium]
MFTLQEEWRGLPQGALAIYPLGDTGAEAPRTHVLFAPGARQSIEQVGVTRDAILVTSYSVRGQLIRFALREQRMAALHGGNSHHWLRSVFPASHRMRRGVRGL